jgi:2-polyprenyl-3-methyl-5-hydroxy-6-metoxy-1,4-benzoquinol methylase
MSASYYREQLEAWLKTIDVKADRVLDVGGAQLPVKGRTKSWEVNKYHILDLPEPHKLDSPNLVFLKRDIQDENCTEGLTEYYDMVFNLEVMEYTFDPVTTLKNLNAFLVPNGVLYISFPFIYPVHNPITDDSIRYTINGAMKLLDTAGFEVENVTARTQKGNLRIQDWFASEKMRPAKEWDHHDDVGYLIKARKL